MAEKTGAAKRREQLVQQYWPDEDVWTGEKEKGWFPSPRTLPLILALLASKDVSENKDPSMVSLDLLSRMIGEGVVEMEHENDHAYASGYVGQRAVRTWQERMAILEKVGFIRTVQVGNQSYKYVALVHPTTAIQHLKEKNKVPDEWWNAYQARKALTKEETFEQRASKKT